MGSLRPVGCLVELDPPVPLADPLGGRVDLVEGIGWPAADRLVA
jgi:hypothetical protein